MVQVGNDRKIQGDAPPPPQITIFKLGGGGGGWYVWQHCTACRTSRLNCLIGRGIKGCRQGREAIRIRWRGLMRTRGTWTTPRWKSSCMPAEMVLDSGAEGWSTPICTGSLETKERAPGHYRAASGLAASSLAFCCCRGRHGLRLRRVPRLGRRRKMIQQVTNESLCSKIPFMSRAYLEPRAYGGQQPASSAPAHHLPDPHMALHLVFQKLQQSKEGNFEKSNRSPRRSVVSFFMCES